jgi:AraC-like DNA-binding protein
MRRKKLAMCRKRSTGCCLPILADYHAGMLTTPDKAEHLLSRRLLGMLRPLASTVGKPGVSAGFNTHGPQLFSYCCFSTERLASVVSDKPRIGILLSGAKEFWLGDTGQRYVAGEVFCLPANTGFDVVNIPSESTGIYESLLVEIDEVPEAVRDLPGARQRADGFDLKVPLTDDLVDALGHAAISLDASDHAGALAQHRLAEVLILLRAVPQAACLFEQSLADRVMWTVRSDPARRWTAASIGRELGIGASTLRRHLSEAGMPLRRALATARLQLAHEMLSRGEGSVTDAVSVAGYASRSHFVRQFREAYGVTPSKVSRAGG